MMRLLYINLFVLLSFTAQAQKPPPALVTVDLVQEQEITETIHITGRVVATNVGPVASYVSAPIEELLVSVGDKVEQGQVLVKLSRNIRVVERDLAKAKYAEQQARLADAKQKLQRQNKLKRSPAYNKAIAQDAEAQVSVAKTLVAQAQAEYELQKIAYELCHVKAPYTGVITSTPASPGNWAQQGSVMVHMLATENLEITLDVQSEMAMGLTVGQVVKWQTNVGEGQATIRALVAQENTAASREVRLSIAASSQQNNLVNGQKLVVHLPVTKADQATVHKDSVLQRNDRAMVYVVTENRANIKVIELGAAIQNRFVVKEGLAAGDAVVIRGNERLRPGQEVNAKVAE